MIYCVAIVTQNIRMKGWSGNVRKWKNLPEYPSRQLLYVVRVIDFLSSLGLGLGRNPPHKRCMLQLQHVLE